MKTTFFILFMFLSWSNAAQENFPIPSFTMNGSVDSAIFICPWDQVIFDGSATVFEQGTTFSSVIWDFGDGTIDTISWPSAAHIYNNPGTFNIVLTVTASDGNTNYNNSKTVEREEVDIFYSCLVEDFCVDSSEINSDVIIEQINHYNLLPYQLNFNYTYPLFIGGMETPTSQIIISGFGEDEVITNANEIDNILINLEHSYIGEIAIRLTCPNEQGIWLQQYNGGATDVGIPSLGVNQEQGTGIDYWWSPNPSYSTWEEEAINYETLPSGSYTSTESFDSLMGCPLNGVWTLEIVDTWGYDDGWLFNWALEFASPINTNTIYLPPFMHCSGNAPYVGEYTGLENGCTGGIIIDPVNCVDDFSCPHESSVFFNFHNIPNPTIYNELDTLYTQENMDSYQWFMNDSIISGATNYYYTPQQEGMYTVDVINTNECDATSSSFYFIPSEGNTTFINSTNPSNTFDCQIVNDYLIINSQEEVLKDVQIYSYFGKLIYQSAAIATTQNINLAGSPSGVYLLIINNTFTKKILLLK